MLAQSGKPDTSPVSSLKTDVGQFCSSSCHNLRKCRNQNVSSYYTVYI